LRLNRFRVSQLLDVIVDAAEKPIRYRTHGNQILFSAAERSQDKVDALVQDGRMLLELGKTEQAKAKFREALERDPKNRLALDYTDIADRRSAGPPKETSKVTEEAVTPNAPVSGEAAANLERRSNRGGSSPRRADMLKKLNEILLSRYEIPGSLPLMEVVKDLSRVSRELDQQKTGVNFVFSREIPEEIAARAKDRLSKIPDFLVTIEPPLRNVRLVDVLDTITKVAVPHDGTDQQTRLKYSIEDYAVVFSYRAKDTELLYTRSYRVDPATFKQGLDGVFANPAGAALKIGVSLQEKVRNFFIAAGIDFSASRLSDSGLNDDVLPTPKAIFYNERTGVLFVRATLRELDLVENALQALNVTPPLIRLQIEVIRLDGDEDFRFAKDLLKNIQGPLRPALTTREFQRFKKAIEGDHAFLPARVLTTLSGRRESIGMDAGLEAKHSVEIIAEYLERNSSFRIAATVESDSKGSAVNAHGTVYDGQTFVLVPGADVSQWPSFITFITPELVDAAGNRAFSTDPEVLSTERTPPQEKARN
jgi:hypothetical protein